MAKETIEVLIEGGKATAAPPLGPALGPMGVNIGQVVSDINSKTQSFKGMQVPVKVIIDTDTKGYKISIGTPCTIMPRHPSMAYWCNRCAPSRFWN